MAHRPSNDARKAILSRVRAIPPGYVRTYGDISPGAPRLAGRVLGQAAADEAPWHRVVRADGSLAKGARQRRLLEAEGVAFRGERVGNPLCLHPRVAGVDREPASGPE